MLTERRKLALAWREGGGVLVRQDCGPPANWGRVVPFMAPLCAPTCSGYSK